MKEFIPTPSVSQLSFGPLTIHFYAICIIVGIFVAIYLGKRRSPENSELINEIAAYVIPSGIIGARFYHVITTPEKYFNRNFLDAFKIWEGGLGIWGAVFGGAIGGLFALKRFGKSHQFLILADALAPGILLAQAIGRFGNWFNGELFGRPTSLPWGLNIPLEKRPVGFETFATFHPTFLYEALWSIAIAFYLLRLKKKNGQIFWLYVLLYSLGRAGIELLRTDYSHLILGVRLNVWTSLICISVGAWQYLKIERQPLG